MMQWKFITMEPLNDFELTDDVALFDQQSSDLQGKLDDIADACSAIGLTINVNKTISLDRTTSNYTVTGQAVDNIESFQYLGIDGGTKIEKASAAFDA